jgi:two-component sensor histidine kinase
VGRHARDRVTTEVKSLRAKLIFLLSFTLLPIGAIALTNAYFGYQHYGNQIAAGALAAGEEALRRDEAIVDRARDLAGALAAMSLGKPDSAEQCRQTLVRLLSIYDEFSNIQIFDRHGFVACAAMDSTNAQPPEHQAWFTEALAGRPFTVNILQGGGAGGEPAIIGAMPLSGEGSSEITGVLAITIRTASLEQALRDVELPAGGGMIVLDRNGQPIVQRSNQTETDDWLPPRPIASRHGGGNLGVFDTKGRDGIERRYVLVPLSGDLLALFGVPIDLLDNAAHFLLYSNAASAVFMWLAALLTTALAVNRLVARPLRRIRRRMTEYSQAKGDVRISDIEGLPGEVQSLAETFNQMADTIANRDEELRQSVERQKALTREIHHRVRNNLQIVNSLMNLQSWRATTAAELAIFSEVQRRVTALGLVHGALYQGDDMHSVELGMLLKDLCVMTEQSLAEAERPPIIAVEADPLNASADIAVPLAFLVTEIVGEAALRRNGDPRANEIRIRLEKSGSGAILTVESDVPLFGDTEEPAAKRHGLNLLSGLVRQLGGSQQVSADQTTVSVSIPNLTASAR